MLVCVAFAVDIELIFFYVASVACTVTGTTWWRAPEYIQPRPVDRKIVTYNTLDSYGFGMIMWQLTHLAVVPYGDSTVNTLPLEREILNGRRPVFTNNLWRPIIEKCWDYNPMQRPSFAEIVSYLMQTNSV